MSSRRRRIWTTWPSCTKGGRPGCERGRQQITLVQRGKKRTNPPESKGSGATEPQCTMRGETKGEGWVWRPSHRGPSWGTPPTLKPSSSTQLSSAAPWRSSTLPRLGSAPLPSPPEYPELTGTGGGKGQLVKWGGWGGPCCGYSGHAWNYPPPSSPPVTENKQQKKKRIKQKWRTK